MATLEDIIKESKENIRKWYEDSLEVEHGNKNAAIKRLCKGVAAGTLQNARDYAAELQEAERRGVTLYDMAGRIMVSPCFIAMVGWVVGEKIMTDDVDIRDEDEEAGDV